MSDRSLTANCAHKTLLSIIMVIVSSSDAMVRDPHNKKSTRGSGAPGNDFSTGWSRPIFSSWGSGGAVSPQRGPGQSPGGKHNIILTTIF